jgi:hypothetical protein
MKDDFDAGRSSSEDIVAAEKSLAAINISQVQSVSSDLDEEDTDHFFTAKSTSQESRKYASRCCKR